MRLSLALTLSSLLLTGGCAGPAPMSPASPAAASPQPTDAASVRPTPGDSPQVTRNPASRTPGLPPPGSTPTTSTASSPGSTELTIRSDTGTEFRFSPDQVDVPTRAVVALTFENLSTVPHNLTFGSPIDAATSTVVEGGTSETIEFSAPSAAGDYDFVCTIHIGMDGTLRVTD